VRAAKEEMLSAIGQNWTNKKSLVKKKSISKKFMKNKIG
jgi:hypothetical protein